MLCAISAIFVMQNAYSLMTELHVEDESVTFLNDGRLFLSALMSIVFTVSAFLFCLAPLTRGFTRVRFLDGAQTVLVHCKRWRNTHKFLIPYSAFLGAELVHLKAKNSDDIQVVLMLNCKKNERILGRIDQAGSLFAIEREGKLSILMDSIIVSSIEEENA